MTLDTYLIDPGNAQAGAGQKTNVEHSIDLSGNAGNDRFVVELSQPDSIRWQISGALTREFPVSMPQPYALADSIVFVTKPGQNPVSEVFSVPATGYLQSKPVDTQEASVVITITIR